MIPKKSKNKIDIYVENKNKFSFTSDLRILAMKQKLNTVNKIQTERMFS